ncbi:uncharacterized protein KY384_007071 [Bacidia gigantensis]|uniref:uncharacterized protein n=1 Tax=Bacidia gigantensis TaxID=2732470 RepID=UPI001D05777F|nr:uncharacterized protein KY384_007071 [Bacidia gigantensis]KAG8528155.1 hypothetical protein KY384_007071 [Bacidia gigantensis]
MEHPDEEGLDALENQESTSDSENDAVLTPRKRFKKLQSNGLSVAESSMANDGDYITDERTDGLTDLDKMHEYVRTSHGIQLEVVRFQCVPLKASILGRALDLRVLQRITLLDTGPQDAFWSLLVKLTNSDSPIAFKSIHTDNVTFPLLKYLSTYAGLEELFLHERRTKSTENDPRTGVDITSIRKQALRPHLKSLRRVMARNERNESWDFDLKTLHVLAMQAQQLEELALNLKSHVYHSLLQILPAFRSLRALHLIVLRAGDRGGSIPFESLSYSIDILSQCPDLRLKYIAIGERVTDLAGHEKFRLQLKNMMTSGQGGQEENQSKKKGKGKAVESLSVEPDGLSDHEMNDKLAKVEHAQKRLRVIRRFEEVESVRIFWLDLRKGRI